MRAVASLVHDEIEPDTSREFAARLSFGDMDGELNAEVTGLPELE